jgi:hypothetical protein
MTVAELIEKLKQFRPDADIVIGTVIEADPNNTFLLPFKSIEKGFYCPEHLTDQANYDAWLYKEDHYDNIEQFMDEFKDDKNCVVITFENIKSIHGNFI